MTEVGVSNSLLSASIAVVLVFYFLFCTIMPSPLPHTSNHISTDSGDDISSVTSSPIGSNSHDAEFYSRNELEISKDSTELETTDQISSGTLQ
jgi:hypothetical protein